MTEIERIAKIIYDNSPMEMDESLDIAKAIEQYVIKARIEELENYYIIQDDDCKVAKSRIAELKKGDTQ